MFPLFTTRCLHVRHDVRDPSGGSENCGRECCPGNFAEMTTSTPFRDFLHAANLRHGTDGFASPPKKGVLRIFSPLKIRWFRPGLNTRTWVLKASTLPLDHRSYCFTRAKVVTRTRLNITLYVHCLCCFYLALFKAFCVSAPSCSELLLRQTSHQKQLCCRYCQSIRSYPGRLVNTASTVPILSSQIAAREDLFLSALF